MWQFLTTNERRRLTALLARLSLLLTGGAGGRQTFLNNNGLGHLAARLPLDATAEVFAGRLVALAEAAGEPLDDPAGLHPLGAVCDGVLRLEDAPRDDRSFLAGLILQYALMEDASAADRLMAEFGAPAGVTPWRAARRVVPLGGPLFYTAASPTLDTLPYKLRTGVRNFVINYLGREGHPVPFGGRAADLARLEQWRAASDRPCLLLAAPGGRGKSALLVRWAEALSRPEWRDAVAVIFVPVSIRFGTNREELIFPCIAVQLAQLLGAELPANWANMAPALWQSLVGDYLRRPLPDGRQLLLIVDGLDEAAWEIGPALFPHDLPPTTRIVVSARYLAGDGLNPRPWLGRLGWERLGLAETLALEALSRDGVREAVTGMGRPLDALVDPERVIDRLYALTEGDPLLVELYVNWLYEQGDAAARLRPEELDKLPPGYAGFFTQWWEAQEQLWQGSDPLERQTVRALLRVLAVALGPLGADDLDALLPGEERITIHQALKPLRRFVIGDGAAVGYSFTHPRLGDYFRERFFGARTVAAQQRAFVDWVRAAVAERRAAGDGARLSPYLLQYAARHLALAGEPPQTYLDLLLNDVWRRDWHHHSGTYSGFLRDVDAVLEQLTIADRAAVERRELAPYIGYEVLCALCHASVNGLVANMPTELLVALRRYGGWSDEQVLGYARGKRDPALRTWALIAVAPYLAAERQEEAYQAALENAEAVVDMDRRSKVLVDLAPYAPQAVYRAAEGLIDKRRPGDLFPPSEGALRAEVLVALAPHLPDAVLAAAEELTVEWQQANVLEALVLARPEMVKTVVKKLAGKVRSRVMVALAPYWSDEEVEKDILPEALWLATERRRTELLIALVPRLSTAQLPQVLRTAQWDASYWREVDVLVTLLPRLSEPQRNEAVQQILAVKADRPQEFQKADILISLAPYSPEAVFEAAVKLTEERSRADVFVALAPHLPEEVYEAAIGLTSEWPRAKVFVALAPHRPEAVFAAAGALSEDWKPDDVFMALAPLRPELVYGATGGLADERRRVRLLIALTAYLPEVQRAAALRQALAATGELGDQWPQAAVLAALSPQLPEAVLEVAGKLTDVVARALVVALLAPQMPEPQRTEVLQRALAAAEHLTQAEDQAQALTALAPHLTEPERTETLKRVLAAAKESSRERRRANRLVELATYLPKEVFNAAEGVTEESARAQVLAALAPLLPELVHEAALKLTDREARAVVLVALVPYLPEVMNRAASQLTIELRQAGDAGLTEVWQIVPLLTAVGPHLPEPQRTKVFQQVVDLVNRSDDETWQSMILATLAPHLPEPQRAEILQRAVDVAGGLEDEEQKVPALAALALHLPEQVFKAAEGMSEEGLRAEVMAALADPLSALPHSALFARWAKMILTLKQLERVPYSFRGLDALSFAASLIPIINSLGGRPALLQTLRAVETVCSWWP